MKAKKEAHGHNPSKAILERRISLLKLIGFLAATPANLLRALASLRRKDPENRGFHNALMRYCCYDRRQRKNFPEIWQQIA